MLLLPRFSSSSPSPMYICTYASKPSENATYDIPSHLPASPLLFVACATTWLVRPERWRSEENHRAAKEASQLKGMRRKFVETWYNQSNIIVINAPRLIGLPGHGLFSLRGLLYCDNGRVSKHASGGATAAAAVQIDWRASGSQPQADGLPRGNRLETGVKASS
ncbi:hypothetical protein BKA81DRAFT_374327 [Phyllosticta paracitricarpa]